MAIINTKSNTSKTKSSLNRVIMQIITGFTTNKIYGNTAESSAYKIYVADYPKHTRSKNESNSIVSRILKSTSSSLLSTFRYVESLVDRFRPDKFKDRELEESVSIRKPITGGKDSDKYLEYLKFIE
jgi:hypothetical protein